MQGKVKLLLLTLFFVFAMSSNVMGYSGKGTAKNPYVIANELDLRDVLMNKGNGTSWVHIALNANIVISSNIEVGEGRFRVFAKGQNRFLRRSDVMSAALNNSTNPKYCMKIYNNTEIVFGYSATSYKLTLNGSAQAFSAKKPCQGWFNIGAAATVTIDNNCILQNTMNNKESALNAPVNLKGTLILNGEIYNCHGINGGAVNISETGVMTINKTGVIHKCDASTEGGAVYVEDSGQLTLNGGKIYDCSADEEGGALFLTAESYTRLLSGEIYNNSSGKTGGGIFSGRGAILEFGTDDGSGPTISGNHAGTSGGGVRCNGGTSTEAGGTTYFYGGKIQNNKADHYGGGISCGDWGGVIPSKILFVNLIVSNNTCGKNGAGIWIGKGIKGIGRDDILIKNCQIYQNDAKGRAGGIKVSSNMMSSENKIRGNSAGTDAGGIYIADNTTYKMNSGTVYNNTASTVGAGVYLEGYFKISDDATVSITNKVYLCSKTFIDIIGKLNYSAGKIACIESEDKDVGTKLVRVNYENKTASAELYFGANADDEYQNDDVSKKFLAYNSQAPQFLRPTEKVRGYDDCWIIISRKYKVDYNGNSEKNVTNLPDEQWKFWHETIHISEQVVATDGAGLNERKHWNTKKDGSGEVFVPGTLYDTDSNCTLYAQWSQNLPKELFITAKDRYFVVGQDISLTKEELLKKVMVEDDLKTGTKYRLVIVEINLPSGVGIAANSDIKPETEINTKSKGEYVLTIKAMDENGKLSKEETMRVYILESPMKNNQVRFISYRYFGTINKKSKWNKSLRGKLSESLLKEESSYVICLSASQIKQIKNDIKNNNNVIDKEMNQKIVHDFKKEQEV